MIFVKTKNLNAESVNLLVSERARNIVKMYSEYTEYSESDIINKFLLNLLEDKEFIEWGNCKTESQTIIKINAPDCRRSFMLSY